MIAYYVHDEKKKDDLIVIPDMGCAITVTPNAFEEFISVNPVFAKWSGDSCGMVEPENFGTVVATREEGGDVCILKEEIWRERMAHYTS